MIRSRFGASLIGLLVVLCVDQARGAPSDGVLVAAQSRFGASHDETLTIHRITASGFDEVYRETGSVRGFGWSDAHTLWVLHADAKGAWRSQSSSMASQSRPSRSPHRVEDSGRS